MELRTIDRRRFGTIATPKNGCDVVASRTHRSRSRSGATADTGGSDDDPPQDFRLCAGCPVGRGMTTTPVREVERRKIAATRRFAPERRPLTRPGAHGATMELQCVARAETLRPRQTATRPMRSTRTLLTQASAAGRLCSSCASSRPTRPSTSYQRHIPRLGTGSPQMPVPRGRRSPLWRAGRLGHRIHIFNGTLISVTRRS